MQVDMDNVYKTKGGHEVVLLSDRGNDPKYPIVGQWKTNYGHWITAIWSNNGKVNVNGPSHINDLVEVKKLVVQKFVKWFNSPDNFLHPEIHPSSVSYPDRSWKFPITLTYTNGKLTGVELGDKS